VILEAIEQAGYHAGHDVWLGLDVASSEFHKNGSYPARVGGRKFNAAQFSDYLAALVGALPDPHHRGRHGGGRLGRLGAADAPPRRAVQLVGDDLFVTNTEILARGIAENVANAILIKPNQIGTLTETLAAIDMATAAGYASVVSHRSGETRTRRSRTSPVGTAATQIKTGSLSRSDRVAKYNQLLRIEEQLGARARYAGREAFPVRRR
jgi:enolase